MRIQKGTMMTCDLSRRDFLSALGIWAMTTAISAPAHHAQAESGLPNASSTELSAFRSGVTHHPSSSSMKFGYTAMTWGRDERQAIDDISALGFPGIQFRANAVTEFDPSELRALLQQHKLIMVALSSGVVDINPAVERDQIAMHMANARYVRAVGGLYLQVLDKLSQQRPRIVTPEECTRLGKLLTEIGKRTADLGIPLGYHNHMNTLSERPGDLERILAASDPRYVHLELDTAHYVGGGGDPARAILQYRNRLLFIHLKDMVDEPMGTEKKQKYPVKFVELGRGRVNFSAIFAALHTIGFHGWAVVELDRVPDKTTTPMEAARISKQYLENKMGFAI